QAVAEEGPSMMPGAGNAAECEPLHSKRIDLAVAMTRYQDLGAMLRTPDERREKMLAVPHGKDDRRILIDPFVGAFRLDREPGRFPNETKVFRCQDPRLLLERPR